MKVFNKKTANIALLMSMLFFYNSSCPMAFLKKNCTYVLSKFLPKRQSVPFFKKSCIGTFSKLFSKKEILIPLVIMGAIFAVYLIRKINKKKTMKKPAFDNNSRKSATAKAILEECKYGNLDNIKDIIINENIGLLNYKETGNPHPLLLAGLKKACKYGRLEIFSFFVEIEELEAEIGKISKASWLQMLVLACTKKTNDPFEEERNKLEIIKIIEAGGSLKRRDYSGQPLCLACRSAFLDIALHLARKGGNLNKGGIELIETGKRRPNKSRLKCTYDSPIELITTWNEPQCVFNNMWRRENELKYLKEDVRYNSFMRKKNALIEMARVQKEMQ